MGAEAKGGEEGGHSLLSMGKSIEKGERGDRFLRQTRLSLYRGRAGGGFLLEILPLHTLYLLPKDPSLTCAKAIVTKACVVNMLWPQATHIEVYG